MMDEIQIIVGPKRGFARINGMVGLPAHGIHPRGRETAVLSSRDFLTDAVDELIVNR